MPCIIQISLPNPTAYRKYKEARTHRQMSDLSGIFSDKETQHIHGQHKLSDKECHEQWIYFILDICGPYTGHRQ